MSTTLYFRQTTQGAAVANEACCNNSTDTPIQLKAGGAPSGSTNFMLDTARGAGVVSKTLTSVTGPTSGIELNQGSASLPWWWWTPAVDQDFTLSGTVTFNLWALESSMNANAAVNCSLILWRNGTAVSTICNTANGTEEGTSAAGHSIPVTPSSTNVRKGDRLIAIVWFDDATATSMGSGFTLTFRYDGATASADGDSFIQLTETIGFLTTDPTIETLWLNEVASDVTIGGASIDEKEAWSTPHGNSATTAVTNSVAGPTAGFAITKTAGGNAIDWYTRQLQSFTLSGPVLVQLRGLTSSALGLGGGFWLEISVCNSDGSSPALWAKNAVDIGGTTQTTYSYYVCGQDTAVADGQRLRLRVLLDDASGSGFNMATGRTATLNYSGTGSPADECKVVFDQSLAEFTGGGGGQVDIPKRRMAQYLPH
jgi:hypothetical protein